MPSLYRYFSDKEHLRKFMERGEVYINSLSYYLTCESESRRDPSEDANIYAPESGLVITNQTTGMTFTVPAQLISKVGGADRIFVFCASTQLSDHLYRKFAAAGCVRIS